MKYTLPTTFKIGVGDSDLQVIGEKYIRDTEGGEESMWHYYAKNSGNVYKNQTTDEGINRYRLWQNDIKEFKKLGFKHYRTSVSMSRILKQNGEINSKAIEWYANYFKALKKENIQLYVTLYHWELPQYLNEIGGWKNKKVIRHFLKHATAVVNNLGEYIDEYFILNEPRCSSLVSYYYGSHAPGERKLKSALTAAHNLLLAQGLAFKELKKIDNNLKLSTIVNVGPRYAETDSLADIHAAELVYQHKNSWFIDPLFLGEYPKEILNVYEKLNAMPEIGKGDMEIIRIGNQLETLGLNYYRGDIVRANPREELGFETFILEHGPKTDLGWGIYVPPHYPEGLYDILQQLYFSYKELGLKKFYITENGIAVKSPIKIQPKKIDDQKRINFLKSHLHQIHKARLIGVPVEGYFTWTLMDNFEWAEGYRPESAFGLIHVDRRTMKRTWKKSAYWYKNLIKTRTLTS